MKRTKKKITQKILPSGIPLERSLVPAPQYYETHKFDKWCEYYFNPKSETYGHSTKSAMKAYDTQNYNSAAAMGSENLKKAKNLRIRVADDMGFGFIDMMKIGMSKMMQGEFDDWDKMMIRLGHFEPDPKTVVNNNTQNNFNFGTLQEAIAMSRKERGLQP